MISFTQEMAIQSMYRKYLLAKKQDNEVQQKITESEIRIFFHNNGLPLSLISFEEKQVKICAVCASEFTSNKSEQRFCSANCRLKNHRKNKGK